jgi:pyruvate ferredoxin oxidoreductase delta subunit
VSLKKWHELIPGAVVLEGGSSAKFKTGSWRAMRPVWIQENCIQCMKCWAYCPDMSVTAKDGKRGEFNYDYCKGCGICALECPGKKGQKAIVMEEEGK